MKIALVSATYYPVINGVATFMKNLAEGLASRGHEVIVICPSFTGNRYVKKENGVTMYRLKSTRLPLYPDGINEVPPKKKIFGREMPRVFYRRGIWICPAPYVEMRKIIKKFQPDVMHSQTPDPIGLAASMLAREFDIPFVTTGHSQPDVITAQLTKTTAIKKAMDAALGAFLVNYQRHCDYATMPTELAIEDLIMSRRRAFRVPVEALSNGVNLSNFKPGVAKASIYKKYHIPKDRPIVLNVGRVDPDKTINRVIEAFSMVVEKIPKAMLVIVGDGKDKARLKDLVEYMDLQENVIFTGTILPPELNEIYRLGDVFVTASEIETQGIVLIEAAASGLPIVAVDRGAVAEVCRTGENGFLCQPGGDTEGIADGILKILSDNKLKKAYGEGSMRIAAKHDINNTLSRFEEIYSEAVEIRLEKVKSL